jgi:hypothetical protein
LYSSSINTPTPANANQYLKPGINNLLFPILAVISMVHRRKTKNYTQDQVNNIILIFKFTLIPAKPIIITSESLILTMGNACARAVG